MLRGAGIPQETYHLHKRLRLVNPRLLVPCPHHQETYTALPENLYVDAANSQLVITARKAASGTITSARIRSYPAFAVQPTDQFPVVRVEARIKVPQGVVPRRCPPLRRGRWAVWRAGRCAAGSGRATAAACERLGGHRSAHSAHM